MFEYICWSIALSSNIFFFVQLLRKGPGNPRDVRIGRGITLALLPIATLYAVYYLANGEYVPGVASTIIVTIYVATVFIVNRYLDREGDKRDGASSV